MAEQRAPGEKASQRPARPHGHQYAVRSQAAPGKLFQLQDGTGAIAVLTAIFTWGLLAKANADGVHDWNLVLVGLLAALCTSHLAVALVNWTATLLAKPMPLPSLP
jgi:hypothetical protein